MSKGSNAPKVTWEHIEGLCRRIFGDRFWLDTENDLVRITFNLSDPAQKNEHDAIAQALVAFEISYGASAPCTQEGSIFIPTDNTMQLTFPKNSFEYAQFKEILVPLLPTVELADKRLYGACDPISQHLTEVTKTPWIKTVPSPYSKEGVYHPVSQSWHLTHEMRLKQERMAVAAFLPMDATTNINVAEWGARQLQTESDNKLPVSTGVTEEILHPASRTSKHRRQLVLDDKDALAEIRSAYHSLGR